MQLRMMNIFKMYIERDSEHHNLLKSDKQEDW